MGDTRRTTRRDATVPPRSDPRHDGTSLTGTLTPGEQATDHAAELLAHIRADEGFAEQQHPDHTFATLPEALRAWEEHAADTSPLLDGMALLRRRYADLGLHRLLPPTRVHVAISSARPGAWGGFHHPNQGYRHLQARVVVTRYGDLATAAPPHPELAMLDLLRSYAHDCLHWGSARRYITDGDHLVRTQYGLNFRRAGGRSYSAPDAAESASTRNIGTVMEGACDREARAITRAVADQHGITAREGIDALALGDVTGRLGNVPEALPGLAPEQAAYLDAMGRYQQGVNARYARFLAEIGGPEADGLHSLLLAAMISGDMRELCTWLDARYGPGAFAAMFMAPGYLGRTGVDLAS